MQANASQLNILHSVMGHFSLSEHITYETVEPVMALNDLHAMLK